MKKGLYLNESAPRRATEGQLNVREEAQALSMNNYQTVFSESNFQNVYESSPANSRAIPLKNGAGSGSQIPYQVQIDNKNYLSLEEHFPASSLAGARDHKTLMSAT